MLLEVFRKLFAHRNLFYHTCVKHQYQVLADLCFHLELTHYETFCNDTTLRLLSVFYSPQLQLANCCWPYWSSVFEFSMAQNTIIGQSALRIWNPFNTFHTNIFFWNQNLEVCLLIDIAILYERFFLPNERLIFWQQEKVQSPIVAAYNMTEVISNSNNCAVPKWGSYKEVG